MELMFRHIVQVEFLLIKLCDCGVHVETFNSDNWHEWWDVIFYWDNLKHTQNMTQFAIVAHSDTQNTTVCNTSCLWYFPLVCFCQGCQFEHKVCLVRYFFQIIFQYFSTFWFFETKCNNIWFFSVTDFFPLKPIGSSFFI